MRIVTKKFNGNGVEFKLTNANATIIIENGLFKRIEHGVKDTETGYFPYTYEDYTNKMKYPNKKRNEKNFLIKNQLPAFENRYCFYIILSPWESFKLKWMNCDHWLQKASTWGFIIALVTSILLTIQTCSQVKTNIETIKTLNSINNTVNVVKK